MIQWIHVLGALQVHQHRWWCRWRKPVWFVIYGKRNQERGRSEILMAVTMKNTVFWDMKPWLMFQSNLLMPSSEPKNAVIRFLRNGNKFLLDHMASHPRRQYSSNQQW